MNRKLISRSNYILKKVLNKEENIDILQDIIESIIGIEISKIKIKPYLEKMSKYLPSEENFGIVDVRIKTKDGQELNVGMQIIDGYYVQNKILLYYAQIHGNQLEYDDEEIVKTITINILDFEYFKTEKCHKIIKIRESTNSIELDGLELHVLELPKFTKKQKKLEAKEDGWLAYLEGSDKEQIKKAKEKYEKIRKLDEVLEEYWENEKME